MEKENKAISQVIILATVIAKLISTQVLVSFYIYINSFKSLETIVCYRNVNHIL